MFHKTIVTMKDTVALRYTLTRDIHIPNKHIYILLHVVIAFILQTLATFSRSFDFCPTQKPSLPLLMNFGSQHENIPMCRMGACTNVPAKRSPV